MASTMFWDSSSSLHNDFEDSSSSRWDHDEIPAFPLPFSALVSPKQPQRQRSMDRQQAIDLMVLNDNREASCKDEVDQASASVPPAHSEDDVDKPRQHMARKLPQRRLSPMRGSVCEDKTNRMAQMRFQYLLKAQQGSARRLVQDSGKTRTPRRSGGFIDITKRTPTV